MYLSRIHLRLERLNPAMLQKWDEATSYSAHQWLWQLFPEQKLRNFLFRQEPQSRFFVLSESPPLSQHELFLIETKLFNPRIEDGLELDFQLRANPVISRKNKRYDVMMDAKYQARASGIAKEKWWDIQTAAASHWLEKQGLQHGFVLTARSSGDFGCWAGDDSEVYPAVSSDCVRAHQQHRFMRRSGEQPVLYSSVDYSGMLRITDAVRFRQALYRGLGKSKSFGCGMLMIKRPDL
ncbi:type I-E CRISPR-associated protein Cas6/Cse3/CasE [Pantoea sp. BAV 3049]|uniref:type I-E CRISPR-associated protein Cas6/Cse3/CasE n=1 Tax=Pantoea sp. BAV 3049 TaxID=2654188 RepID=UPI00131EB030|nr:type I-E CRISPR-associated protein Cas6/Cse3/CasE [Pantoea sp. BAV 3049]